MVKNPQMPGQAGDYSGKRGGQPRGGRSEKDLGLVDSSTISKGDYTNPECSDTIGRPKPVTPKGLDERRRGDSFRWK